MVHDPTIEGIMSMKRVLVFGFHQDRCIRKCCTHVQVCALCSKSLHSLQTLNIFNSIFLSHANENLLLGLNNLTGLEMQEPRLVTYFSKCVTPCIWPVLATVTPCWLSLQHAPPVRSLEMPSLDPIPALLNLVLPGLQLVVNLLRYHSKSLFHIGAQLG